jgi:hypothetical protein
MDRGKARSVGARVDDVAGSRYNFTHFRFVGISSVDYPDYHEFRFIPKGDKNLKDVALGAIGSPVAFRSLNPEPFRSYPFRAFVCIHAVSCLSTTGSVQSPF